MDKAKLRETPKAAAAFYEYCLLGHDRSLVKLAYKLGKTSAYTRCLETWSSQHNWQERVKQYDADQAAKQIEIQDKIIAEEREKVLRSGFALMHKRVEMLDRLSNKLIQWTDEEKKVWIPETRVIGSGENAQTIENITFNAPLYTLIDKYLDSIAKETGERVKVTKSELSGKVDGDHTNTEKIMFYLPVVDDEDDAEPKGGDANADNSDSEGDKD